MFSVECIFIPMKDSRTCLLPVFSFIIRTGLRPGMSVKGIIESTLNGNVKIQKKDGGKVS